MKVISAVLIGSVAATSFAGTISTYSDRGLFAINAGGPVTVEDFTSTYHAPLASNILNSLTEDPFATNGGVHPGDIQAGVTYSTEPSPFPFSMNIDSGLGYSGGFIDGIGGSPLRIDFTGVDPMVSRSVFAFGFDMGSVGGASTITQLTISFESGPDQVFNLAYNNLSLEFFGFVSDASDITSVMMSRNDADFKFDMDNFTFNAVPSPSSLSLLAMCGLVANCRRR